VTTLLAALAAFAIGSVPFGFLLVRVVGRGDIRDVGSGNIGATNVGRLLGPAGWLLTLLADAGKGCAGVWVGGLIAGSPAGPAAGAVGAVLGHCFTPWLRGRGGKGVATMIGAFGFLTPASMLGAIAAFAGVVLFSRFVSLGSLVAASALPAIMLARGEPVAYAVAALLVAVVVFARHWPNIRRLRAGTEARVGGRR
jgi:glycerol-3-phosphate acyltransferase PlsY